MEASILTSVKNTLGLAEDYDVFDEQIITHINSAFSTLNQLGVGPVVFMIEDDSAEWSSFSNDDVLLGHVRTYIYLKVRLAFDPPTTSYAIAAFERQVQEVEWRISVYREGTEWVDPNEPVVVEDL